MVNIVIPMAGDGSRFKNEGYKKPKPFIDVKGKPMIVRVLENLEYEDAKYILLVRKDHFEKELELVEYIKKNFNCEFIIVDKLTEGTACTVLYARKFLDREEPLIIANSDQIIDIKIKDFIEDCSNRNLDGSIITFIDPLESSKWSFAKINENGLVAEVREKKVISEYATVGIYFYNKGKYFLDCAIDMIARNERVNNEFYVCPIYNYIISEGKKIGIYNIEYYQMHGIGTPDDLKKYLEVM